MPSPFDQDHRTPVSLIVRLRRGTDDEWRTFCDIYGPMVFRLARGLGLPDADANDVVGDVMQALLVRLRRGFAVDHGKGRFRDYLARATRHAAIRHQRRHPKPKGISANSRHATTDGHLPGAELAALERLERLRLCMDRLPLDPSVRRRDLDAFREYVLNNRPAQEVAKRFGISRARLYGIRTEMIDRIRRLAAELDATLGEV